MKSKTSEQLALTSDVVDRALKFSELRQAIAELATPKTQVLEDARIFLDNVYRKRVPETRCRELVNKMMNIREKWRTDKELMCKHAAGLAKCKGDLAHAEARRENILSAKSGHTGFLEYKRKEVAQTEQKLENARQREQKYTYRMWGRFTDMWKNDVALAKNDVGELSAKLVQLQEQMRTLATGSDAEKQTLDRDYEKNSRELESAKVFAKEAERLFSDSQRQDAEWKEKDIDCHVQLQSLLDEEGKVSVDHFLKAHQAHVAFAESAHSGTAVAENVVEGWVRGLDSYVDMMAFIMDAPTLEEQKDLLSELRQLVDSKSEPLLSLVMVAGSLPSLALPNELPEHVRPMPVD